MYTKDKWQKMPKTDTILQNEKGRTIAVFNFVDMANADEMSLGEAQDNINRVCQCVNNFDALLEACKMVMEVKPQERMNDNTLAYVAQAIQEAEK